MSSETPSKTMIRDRCRLIMVVDALEMEPDAQAEILSETLAGGDVATVILASTRFMKDGTIDEERYMAWCRAMVPAVQAHEVAAIVMTSTQALGRCGADGYLADFGKEDAKDLIARFSPQKMVGLFAIRDRHRALEAGELNPDFVFFGKVDGDIKPEPHPKNLALGEWWSQMIEIPGIVMSGSTLESIVEVAKTGIDFAACGLAVTTHVDGGASAVRQANALLDEHAPDFEQAED